MLTVLSDDDVRAVLDTLTRDDVLAMHKSLSDALHDYSTSTDADTACCGSNQPKRIMVQRKDGSNTLFMPSMSDSAAGVKIIHVSGKSPNSGSGKEVINLPLRELSNLSESTTISSSAPSTGTTRSSSPVSSSFSAASPSTNTSRDTSLILEPGTKVSRQPPADTDIQGSLTLIDTDGRPRAFINATSLTAFRTALASTIILKKRRHAHTVTIFGAGLQAYWHAHLTLLLRGSEVHHLNIVNRDFTRAQKLLMSLAQSENESIADALLGESQKLKPTILTPDYGEYDRLLKEYVRAADIIFCCTPSTAPLFPASVLTNTEGRRKARYIAAIGSYKPHMQELHEDILRQAVSGPNANKHHSFIHLHHKHANEGGAVIVDTIEGAMRESGDIIKAGIGGHGVVELGELVMLKRSHWAEKAERERLERETSESSSNSSEASSKKSNQHFGHGLGHLFHKKSASEDHSKSFSSASSGGEISDGGLADWLERGNVIYKSVGIGLMDVVVGMELVKLAEKRGIGTTILTF